MRLKYYLRGVGIGVLISALVFSIYLFINPASISDDEVIRRARNLGMVESTDNNNGTIQAQIDAKNSEEEDSSNESDGADIIGEEESSSESSDNDDSAVSEPVTEEIKEGTFSIIPGSNSYDVAKNLQGLGIIEDALDFDKYMSDKGVDNLLRAGTFTVNNKMSYDEIINVMLGR